MAKNEKEELKCICNGKPKVLPKYKNADTNWVECKKCGILTKPCKTKNQAIKIWNEWR